MAYEAYCAACTYMKETGSGGKYWCEKKGQDLPANTSRCYGFCEAYSRSNYTRENMIDCSKNSTSGCYLTTIMCKLLDYPDNNYYLNTLRKFRDEVMQTNPKYIPLLITYDTIGPMISYELERDPHGKQLAEVFFNHFIIPSVGAIEEEKYETAINTYKAMTNALAEQYNIDRNIIVYDNVNYDKTTLGHGKIKKRTQE